MKKIILMVALGVSLFGVETFSQSKMSVANKVISKTSNNILEDKAEQLYKEMKLENKVSLNAFKIAFNGYSKIEKKTRSVLTVIDFSKPSTKERMFVLDLSKKKILFSSHVAHGKNSGENMATSFSNKVGSYQSSPGFYLTENTYMGGNGYSLVLNGLEKGINDKAKERYVVIHGAKYANPVSGKARLGRSYGCPALPTAMNKPIIDSIKNGSVLYIHTESTQYTTNSSFVQRT
ncbi:MAG: murein L,D-transpeptidase catalytic domain family protein [Fusobacteriaceae bacterium]